MTKRRSDDESQATLLDRLVAAFADQCARGEDPDPEGVLGQVDPSQRSALKRCLDLIVMGDGGEAPLPLHGGQELGGFELIDILGRGGMAMVWRARDLKLDREVALKILRSGLATEPRHRERFLREGRAVARLNHPNVIRIHAVGEDQGHLFLAMERIAGPSLAALLGQLPIERKPEADDLATLLPHLKIEGRSFERIIAGIFAQAAEGLEFAHAAGIVHRDLKPSNLLLRPDGSCVVGDFGLARQEAAPDLSLTGEVLGTPFYMSPEQVDQHRSTVDARTDLYSLGVSFYEALAGRRPFQGSSAVQVFDAIRNETPPLLRELRPDLSPDADAVISRAMARDPADRYATAAALKEDLQALSRGEATEAATRRGSRLQRMRRAWTQMRRSGLVYRSPRVIWGLPLVHINQGPRKPGDPLRRARGWFAIGDVATGVFALGSVMATGVFAMAGAASFGLFSTAGALAAGFCAVGGGLGVGVLALGGFAAGYIAVGGGAFGVYALGGLAEGAHVLSGKVTDPEALRFFKAWLPWLIPHRG